MASHAKLLCALAHNSHRHHFRRALLTCGRARFPRCSCVCVCVCDDSPLNERKHQVQLQRRRRRRQQQIDREQRRVDQSAARMCTMLSMAYSDAGACAMRALIIARAHTCLRALANAAKSNTHTHTLVCTDLPAISRDRDQEYQIIAPSSIAHTQDIGLVCKRQMHF